MLSTGSSDRNQHSRCEQHAGHGQVVIIANLDYWSDRRLLLNDVHGVFASDHDNLQSLLRGGRGP